MNLNPKSGQNMNLITKEIRSLCEAQNYEATESMALLAITNVIVNPIYKFYDHDYQTNNVIQLTSLASKHILSKKTLKLKLFKAQAYFEYDFCSQENVLSEHKKLLDIYVEPLWKHIIKTNEKKIKQNYKVYYRQLVLLVILLSGLGDPNDRDVYIEAECGVASVLPPMTIDKFSNMSIHKKTSTIEEITRILVGIRLFNKVRNCGGAGMEDLPKMLRKACLATETLLNEAYSRINRKLHPLELAVEQNYYWDAKFSDVLCFQKSHNLSDSDYFFAKELLCLWQQIGLYISILQTCIRNHMENLKHTVDSLNVLLNALTETMRTKVAIESNLIFPEFKKLHKHWKVFQDMMVLLSVYYKLLKKMLEFSKVTSIPRAVSDFIAYGSTVEQIKEDKIDPEKVRLEVLKHDDLESDASLEFGGFCPIYCLYANGTVIRVNTNIGILRHMGKYYGFRNTQAAYCFAEDPEKVIAQLVDFVRKRSEYIEILQMRKILAVYKYPYASEFLFSKKKIPLRDKFVQTELHPVYSSLDYEYRHSTWALKADACKLANLMKMKTHSAQTDLSHYKQDANTQTTEVKEVYTQTKVDNSTNVPKLQNFIYGLRGRTDDCQHIVELTRPVDEGFTNVVQQ